MIRIESINIAVPTSMEVGGKTITTGIHKQPASGPVGVTALGLAGDAICNSKVHGGPDQAVYLYRTEDYDWWAAELGRDMPAGLFGENLTVSGLAGPGLNVGDQLHFGDVKLEVTAPRIPCNTLAARMQDRKFGKRFMQAERPGIYFRVLAEGDLSRGDTATLVAWEGAVLSTVTFFRDFHSDLSVAEMQFYLSLPIDARSREDLAGQLEKRT